MAVYVDDFLITMNDEELPGAFAAIKQKWKCSEEEYVNTHTQGYEVLWLLSVSRERKGLPVETGRVREGCLGQVSSPRR